MKSYLRELLTLRSHFAMLLPVGILSACATGASGEPEQVPFEEGAGAQTTQIVSAGVLCPGQLPPLLREDACFHAMFETPVPFANAALSRHTAYRTTGVRERAGLPTGVRRAVGVFSQTQGLSMRVTDGMGNVVPQVESAPFEQTMVDGQMCPIRQSYFIPIDPANTPYTLELEGGFGDNVVVVEDLSGVCR